MSKVWISRFLIGVVTAWDLQAAFLFIFSPQRFLHAYELSGVPGETAIRGVGVLFLMWNIPYLAALWNPIRFRLALILAISMQFVGVIGEGMILFTLPEGHIGLYESILRFVIFDGTGLLLLIIVFLLIAPVPGKMS